jgi:two-component system cell cycle response regulator CtrA
MRLILATDATEPEELITGLQRHGVIVDRADSFNDLPSIVALSGPFDVALLQVTSPLWEARVALRSLRRCGMALPIIVLANTRQTPEAEEAALHAGADDVIFQPLRLSVVHARLQALARRARGYACAELHCGNVVLEQDQHQVMVDGRRVNLTAREFDFLETLMLHKGVLLTKERFMTSLYADATAPDSKIVDVFVCKLRRKLAACGAAEMIRTVWGRGYVLFEPSDPAVALAREAQRPQPAAEPSPRGWMRRAERLQTVGV